MSLTDTQLDTIDLAERLGGSFSLLGSALILATYFASAAFRKPVTRLIFYATFGNIFSAVASLIGRDGIRKGPDSPLCQVQAFFIQWYVTDHPPRKIDRVSNGWSVLELDASGLVMVILYGAQYVPHLLPEIHIRGPEEPGKVVFRYMLRVATHTRNSTVRH